jgi:hypothetical protein
MLIIVVDVLGQKKMLSWCRFDTVSVSSGLILEFLVVALAIFLRRQGICISIIAG